MSFGHLYYQDGMDPQALASEVGKKRNGQIAGLDIPAWNITGFYPADAPGAIADSRIALGTANARYFPSTIDGVRNMDLHLFDFGLSKNFRFAKNQRIQVRLEAINALNYQVLWNPDTNPRSSTFGYYREIRNNPRDVQLGIRWTF